MTKHRSKKRSNLLDRCLRDVKSGQLWLSATDRRKYQCRFGELGVKVSKPFASEEALLSAWCQSLSPERGIVLYELARLSDPSLPPLVTELDRWPKARREQYLMLRVQARLHHLFETEEAIRAWLDAYLSDRHATLKGTVEFDGQVIVDLDRAIAELIAKESKTDGET